MDHGGNLWIVGVRGLIRRSPDGRITRYGDLDKLPIHVLSDRIDTGDVDSVPVVFGHAANRLHGKIPYPIPADGHEFVAVEPRQSFVGAQPEVAVGGLGDGAVGVLGKAVQQ